MTFYILLGLMAFLTSLLGTRITILTLRNRALLLDMPSLRSNHTRPTPRAGGISVVFGLIICLAIADIHFAIILSLLLLAAVSLLDDLINLPVLVRLLVQVMAVTIGLATFPEPILHHSLPVLLDHVMVGLLWIWFINLFNFMDGIDGISATEMITIGGGLALIAVFMGEFPTPLSVYGIVIASAACGFLWWNWQPAKIFLGDVGSIPIGFLLGYVLLLAMQAGFYYAAIIIPAYYLADSGITLLKRLWRGEKIWQAHSEHYYQRAVRHGRSHAAVVRYIAGLNIMLVFLAIYSILEPQIAGYTLALAYMSVCLLLGFLGHTTPNPQHDLFK